MDLRSKEGRLEKTLTRAHNKIKNNNINFNITDEELEALTENVMTMEYERQRLHTEYTRLSTSYQKMETITAGGQK